MMRLQESDRKVASVYVLSFSKMGFGTPADNFIALRIIKKSKILPSLGVDYPMGDLLLCLTGCNTQLRDAYGVKDTERATTMTRTKRKTLHCGDYLT